MKHKRVRAIMPSPLQIRITLSNCIKSCLAPLALWCRDRRDDWDARVNGLLSRPLILTF